MHEVHVALAFGQSSLPLVVMDTRRADKANTNLSHDSRAFSVAIEVLAALDLESFAHLVHFILIEL
jgi:hypothetical protein